ncbi:CpsB/CapC family capsule biosynthesis tyrosine phosphatase [Paenibacillus sp. MMS20-IR301]|uniref:tyrosine-protein phosphatase n=1 Tax=Paenibacillus sp. MMS20-IR301 TaxID=2895946 RepID=UPI0028ED0684|nr:CpsB/CapC family capsule biosynthesis tyrosine phosphatase [Paenibacillus sp. MMS20-IR301]WNS43516.1 CpsB/CapC family capsule biosynthesis tyrosine phosphatase [Paenibacillus sp. MMS20-IR301]
MIDIHSHILPFMDDGAADLTAALAMAQDANNDGITTVVATPHHANGVYMNPAGGIIPAVQMLNDKLREAGNPLQVLAGQEIRLYGDLLDDLERGELLTLAGSRYILLEMPSSRVPRNMEEVCHELIIQGYVPVIAHPERNAEIAGDPAKLERLIELGALGQLTAQSLAGTFGSKLQKLSMDLCRRGTIQVIASDAHDSVNRPFKLSEAYEVVKKEWGATAFDVFLQNAQNITRNNEVIRAIPLQTKTQLHKLFGFFSRKG